MQYSKLFGKTNKSAKEFDSINATLLHKAGFIDQTMAGVYTFLPLGLRVLNKIENIVRSEMDLIASELVMPSLSPKTLWEQTNRLEKIDVLMKATAANAVSLEKNSSEYILNPTHEELITPIVQKFSQSYKNFPVAVYQIQTKFRNEPRPKSGIMRGREFRMKDLYSFHLTQEDFKRFYLEVIESYKKVYTKLGIGHDTFVALASGGDFTTEYSHEFQTKCDNGEDTIFYVPSKDIYYNKEVAPTQTGKLAEEGDLFPETGEKYEVFKASEVGNVFPLGTKFSDAFDFTVNAENGNKNQVYMGCYGIGTSRLMGVIVEKCFDEKGIVWPEPVAPFRIHLAALGMDQEEIYKQAFDVYERLLQAGHEVLFDDRVEVSAGAKLGDADLIGCPYRIVVSKKTGEQVEFKRRNEENSELITFDELLEKL
jgi:prolyl-tRNA synthetase